MLTSRRALFAAVAALGAPAALSAQVVRGIVLDEASGQPIYGAIVVLIADSSRKVAGAISDDSGRFALRAPTSGHYVLRADRIGYRSTSSQMLSLADGQALDVRLAAPVVPIALTSVLVRGDDRCVVHPAEGLESAAVWQEARKALYATQLVIDEKKLYVKIRDYVRWLDPTTMHVRQEQATVRSGLSERPIASPRTPEQLAANGFKDDTLLIGPDADVLLSDAFADTHCFHMKHDDKDHAGLVGLAFEPAKKRKKPDVAGVLWLDQKTAELRFVEFRHTGLFPTVSPRKYGGRIEFERLAGGVWIVRRWWIRTPDFTAGPDDRLAGGDMRTLGATIPEPVRYREDGGEVISAVAVTPAPPPRAPRP